MGKTINKGPCYCCEDSSSSSVTSSVSSSTSSVTSSVSGDFCCTPTGAVTGTCTFSHGGGGGGGGGGGMPGGGGMGGGDCSWYVIGVTNSCGTISTQGRVCPSHSTVCGDNFPACVKESWCVMPGSLIWCGPWDDTNCGFFGDDPYACIDIIDVGDSFAGHCYSSDSSEGSPCPTHNCTCYTS